MKTLANCSSKEFFAQTALLAETIQKYADSLKKLKEVAEGGKTDILSAIKYICGDNIEETMNLCGALCFMSGEEFANLTPDENGDNDGIAAIAEIIRSQRCIGFFTSALQMQKFIERL